MGFSNAYQAGQSYVTTQGQGFTVAQAERQQAIGNMLQGAINRKAGLGVSLYRNWSAASATTPAEQKKQMGTDIILG